jgi:tetratricopeptide (TPR) repeat protein
MAFLFFIFLSLKVFALETGTGAIDQAQILAMKKNRREACAVLNKAIGGLAKNRARTIEQIHNLSKMFFTDKGQKAYEAGQGAAFENPDVALNWLLQALELEDSNVLILASLARLSLIRNDCDNALAYVRRARELNPYFGEAAVLELSALNCLAMGEAMREKTKTLPPLSKWEEGFVQYLTAQVLLRQGQAKRAVDLLQKFSDENPQFPEAYFYKAKAGLELKQDVAVWRERYVSLCKGITVRERAKFALEPHLCMAAKEVEDELAKSGRDS